MDIDDGCQQGSVLTGVHSEAAFVSLGNQKSAISSLSAGDTKSLRFDQQQDNSNSNLDQEAANLKKSEIDFYRIPVIGRTQEVSILIECYKRIASESSTETDGNQSEVVLISGDSGTGKSKLAEVLRQPVSLQSNGFFVSGKFDRARKDPYSALVEAFTDLCDLVSQQEEEECGTIAKTLREEVSVLNEIIPNLWRITGSKKSIDENEGAVQSMSAGKDSFVRFKLSCRRFVNAIASRKHPVVLLLDDLQWADESSLEVIKSLVTDKESKFVLIIGTHRDHDENDEDFRVEHLLQPPKEGDEYRAPCTLIQLKNFGLDQITTLVSSVTGVYPSKTAGLAALILKRTRGLPFFVVKFMEMLQDRRLMWYDFEADEWTWSVPKIQTETAAADNVVEAVSDRLKQLEQHVQSVLTLAAVQGYRFDRNVLIALVDKEMDGTTESINSLVINSLKDAKEFGLIECNQDGSFQFCHDRIHEGLYSMIPTGNRLASLHYSVGKILQKKGDDEGFICSIADHLNRGSQAMVSEDKYDCAQCNLRASNLGMRKSAFALAAKYARSGLAQLDASIKWSDACYETTLELHCSAADAYYSCGDVERCDNNIEEVYRNARSVVDANRAYTIKMLSLGAQARLDEAIEVAFFAARQLGVKIPKKPNMVNAIWQIFKTKMLLRGKTDEQLLAIPRGEENSNARKAFVLLGIASHYASLCMKIPHLCLSIVLMVQLSVNRNAAEPSAFASYGILENVMGNTAEAVRMGRLALRLQEAQGNPKSLSATLSITHTLLAHWRTPLQDSLEPLVRAHRIGMETADFNDGFLAIQTYMEMAFWCDCTLTELDDQMRYYCTYMLEFDHKSTVYVSLMYWQMCLNLRGQNEAPTVLIGEAMDGIAFEQELLSDGNSVITKTLNGVRIMLCYYFEDVSQLRVLLSEYDGYDNALVGHFMQYVGLLYVGLSQIALYRRFVKRAYKRKATKIIKQLRKWTDDGCTNTEPLLALLEVEMATLTCPRDVDKVLSGFDQAIAEARKFGNAGLEAMCNERAARYFQYHAQNQRVAKEYMDAALDLYRLWGAIGKAEHLVKNCPWTKRTNQGGAPREIIAKTGT